MRVRSRVDTLSELRMVRCGTMGQRSVVRTVSDPWTSFSCLPFHFRRATRVATVGFSGVLIHLNPIRCFSLSELRSATERFSSKHILDDENPNVMVYRGVLASGEAVKVKRVLRPGKYRRQQFQDELGVLSRLHHLNLIRLVGYCKKGGEQLLVYETLGNGTLSDHLHDPQRSRLPWQKRVEIALGVARGIAHVHEHARAPSVHRNIKSSSILLDDKLVPKVSEVGFSNLKQTGADTEQCPISMGYLPPEYYCTGEFTNNSDVYAFGVVLLELLTAKKAFERQRHYNNEKVLLVDLVRSAVKQGGWATVQRKLDPAIKNRGHGKELEQFLNLALYCTEDDLEKRPSMRDLVDILEDFVQGIQKRQNRRPVTYQI